MTKLFTLRPVQERAINMLRDSLRAGHRCPQLELPTGAGKTVIGAHIVHGVLERKMRVAFTVPLLSLIDQTVTRFRENGIPLQEIGVFQADHPMRNRDAHVQVCSVQTLARRGLPPADVVLVDESHLQYSIIYDWMEQAPKTRFIGLSATPWAKGMGEHYDDLVKPTSLKEMIEVGDCSKFRCFAPTKVDLSGVAIEAGDYAVGQLSSRMQEKSIVADVVSTWLQRAEGRPTMVFCVDRAHASSLHDSFCASGVTSAYVDAYTSAEERDSIRKLFHRGEIRVVCSVGTMIAGVDWDVRCISFCRPTKSPIIYVQAVGRGLRPAAGKDHLLLLDHSNATIELGLPTEIAFSKLRGGKRSESNGETEKKMASPRECPKCTQIVGATEKKCPCGHVFRFVSKVKTQQGELSEIGASAQPASKNKIASVWDRATFYGELKYFAIERGFKPGWAANKYREKFGKWPSDDHPDIAGVAEVRPSFATRGWIKSQEIRWAKSSHRRIAGESRT